MSPSFGPDTAISMLSYEAIVLQQPAAAIEGWHLSKCHSESRCRRDVGIRSLGERVATSPDTSGSSQRLGENAPSPEAFIASHWAGPPA